jgi:hypothetical protein
MKNKMQHISFPRMRNRRERLFTGTGACQVRWFPYGLGFLGKISFPRVLMKTLGHILFPVEILPTNLSPREFLGKTFP